MKPTIALSLFALLVSSAALAADGEPPRIVPKNAIESVTVYPDGATVTRKARVTVPKGRSVVAFEGLTPVLDDASIAAKVLGSSTAKVTGLSAEWSGNLEPIRESEAKLTSQLEDNAAKIQAANDRLQVLATRRNVLEQYRNLAKQAIAEQAGGASGANARWKQVLDFSTRELQSIAADVRAANQELKALSENRSALSQELSKIKTTGQQKTRTVEIEIEARTAGPAEISFDYAVYGAGWFPAYDARQDGDKLNLTYYGTIVQGTGEDWNDIRLTLSTARPTERAQVPKLTSLMLSGHKREKRPVQIVSYGKKKAKEAKNAEATAALVDQTLSGRVNIDDKGNAVTFEIKGKETLPADRRPHKVEVTTLALDSTLSFETIPKIAPWVFLKATSSNTSRFPILAGDVNVFRSSGYIGTSSLEYVAPGEEFHVSLGVDEELKVRRVIDERVDTKPTLFGSTRKLTYAYSIELENYKGDAQSIYLVENLPVTQRTEIKVDIREGTTKPDLRDDEGFLRWKVDLKPGAKDTIYFGYIIEYPKDFQLGGL